MTGQQQIALNPCNHCRIVDACRDAHDDDEHPPCSRPAPQPEMPIRSYCAHPDAGTRRSCSGLCRGPGPADDCEYFRHELSPKDAVAIAREDENKRIVKILEDYRFGLEYPDCPPGDTIKKLVESIRQQHGGEQR